MAKAAEIPGLDAHMTYAQAAARTITVRGEEVFEHSAGVLDTGDIERVHAMRVATRRLRAVLEVYAPCFERENLRPVLQDNRALAGALAAAEAGDLRGRISRLAAEAEGLVTETPEPAAEDPLEHPGALD